MAQLSTRLSLFLTKHLLHLGKRQFLTALVGTIIFVSHRIRVSAEPEICNLTSSCFQRAQLVVSYSFPCRPLLATYLPSQRPDFYTITRPPLTVSSAEVHTGALLWLSSPRRRLKLSPCSRSPTRHEICRAGRGSLRQRLVLRQLHHLQGAPRLETNTAVTSPSTGNKHPVTSNTSANWEQTPPSRHRQLETNIPSSTGNKHRRHIAVNWKQTSRHITSTGNKHTVTPNTSANWKQTPPSNSVK